LGLKFVREDSVWQDSSTDSPEATSPNICPEQSLPAVPPQWLQEFQQALLEGEIRQLRQLIEQVSPQTSSLAKQLETLLENLELDEISQLVQSLPVTDP
jgi:hypothetical protein